MEVENRSLQDLFPLNQFSTSMIMGERVKGWLKLRLSQWFPYSSEFLLGMAHKLDLQITGLSKKKQAPEMAIRSPKHTHLYQPMVQIGKGNDQS